jgi:hypothetical protein
MTHGEIGFVQFDDAANEEYPASFDGAAATTDETLSIFAPTIVETDVTFTAATKIFSKTPGQLSPFRLLSARGNETIYITDIGSSVGTAGFYEIGKRYENGDLHVPDYVTSGAGLEDATDVGVSLFGVEQQVYLRGYQLIVPVAGASSVQILGHDGLDVYNGLDIPAAAEGVWMGAQATMYPGNGILLRKGFSGKVADAGVVATVFFSRVP